MYLWHIFLIKPLAALSIVVCLVTIFSCFRMERRRPQKTDRFLIGFLGILTVYQALRILQTAGVLAISMNTRLDDAIELLIALFYLIAAMLLRFSSINHLEAESAYRLVRAAPPRLSPGTLPLNLPVPTKGLIIDGLEWALPRLTDGAFKLYAYLYVRADAAGKVSLMDRDVQMRMQRSPNELQTYYTELEDTGFATICHDGGRLDVEISTSPVPVGLARQSVLSANS